MTVKEVFELRKQGKIEEAYEAIRPMYAVHKGKYTTLCMFWTASDILKKRIAEGRLDEAVKIFRALLRILPNIDDAEGRAHTSIYYEAVSLACAVRKSPLDGVTFSMLDFVGQLKVEDLRSDDWKPLATPPVDGKPTPPVPSVAQQMLSYAFREIEESPTVDNALKAMALLQEAVRRHPRDKSIRDYMAVVYRIMGEGKQA